MCGVLGETDAPVEIVVPPPGASTGTDEFGLRSTRLSFNAEAAVNVIRREEGLRPVEVTVSEGAASAAPGARLIIDLRPLPRAGG